MDIDISVRSTMLDAMPQLHKFAVSLCRDFDRANDLTQQTLLRAWANIETFEPGSNMIAWLFTILRNEFYSEYRKRRREVEDIDGFYAESVALEPNQLAALEYDDLLTAVEELPVELRRVLVFVSSDDVCYAQAARTFNCAEGTIKSRVHRARARLAETLSIDRPSAQDKRRERVAIRDEPRASRPLPLAHQTSDHRTSCGKPRQRCAGYT